PGWRARLARGQGRHEAGFLLIALGAVACGGREHAPHDIPTHVISSYVIDHGSPLASCNLADPRSWGGDLALRCVPDLTREGRDAAPFDHGPFSTDLDVRLVFNLMVEATGDAVQV